MNEEEGQLSHSPAVPDSDPITRCGGMTILPGTYAVS